MTTFIYDNHWGINENKEAFWIVHLDVKCSNLACKINLYVSQANKPILKFTTASNIEKHSGFFQQKTTQHLAELFS